MNKLYYIDNKENMEHAIISAPEDVSSDTILENYLDVAFGFNEIVLGATRDDYRIREIGYSEQTTSIQVIIGC